MAKYNNYSYIFPPRPKNAIPASNISVWDNGQMIGQPKMNGSNCVIFTNGDTYRVMGRHNQILTNFELSKSELSELYKPVDNGWLVINGEYLNKSKLDETGKVFNHKLVIFDILVLNSNHLIGSTFVNRIETLDNLYGTNECEKDYLYQYTDNIYRVKSYESDFVDLYKKLIQIDVVEGIVFKRKNARLEMGTTENNNAKSMIKARKPTKNYKF